MKPDFRMLMAAAALFAIGLNAPASAQDENTGRSEYLANCAACHGVDGKGKGPLRDKLRTKPIDLTTLAKRAGGRYPADTVFEMIDGRTQVRSHRADSMPIWGCRYDARPFTIRKKRGIGRGVRSKPLESLLNLPCDSEEAIRGRIQNVVDYLRTIQQP